MNSLEGRVIEDIRKSPVAASCPTAEKENKKMLSFVLADLEAGSNELMSSLIGSNDYEI